MKIVIEKTATLELNEEELNLFLKSIKSIHPGNNRNVHTISNSEQDIINDFIDALSEF